MNREFIEKLDMNKQTHISSPLVFDTFAYTGPHTSEVVKQNSIGTFSTD